MPRRPPIINPSSFCPAPVMPPVLGYISGREAWQITGLISLLDGLAWRDFSVWMATSSLASAKSLWKISRR